MQKRNTVQIWDLFVRIFHWSLVFAFLVAYVTEEDVLSVHTLAGYVVISLVLLRLVWGVIGPRYARFSDFAYSPSKIRQFLVDTSKLRARRYLGHNPAGGAMIFLLIACLVLTAVSGLVVYGAADQAGPLARLFVEGGESVGELFEEIHEFFANFTVFLVLIHVAGVMVESLIHRENLMASMITGKKRAVDDPEGGLHT